MDTQKSSKISNWVKIQVHENQSAASLINYINRAEERDIELIFPETAAFFNDAENLELLKNLTALSGKHIIIVSPNKIHIESAKNRGIPAEIQRDDNAAEETSKTPQEEPFFQDIEQELKHGTAELEGFTKRYFDLGKKKQGEQDNEKNEITEEPLVLAEEKIPQDETEPITLFEAQEERKDFKEEVREISRKEWKYLWFKLGAGVLVLILFLVAYIYLPKATVTVFAQREKISFNYDVRAGTSTITVDGEKRAVPVKVVEVTKELSSPFEVKEKGAFSSKTKGKITVYNDNVIPQFMIPSRFESISGKIYWSQRSIRIPARGSLEIEVTADKPGEIYNFTCSAATPCRFTVPAWKGTDNFKKIYAKTTASLTGGTAGEGFLVTEEEYQKAETALHSDLLKEAETEFSSRIPSGYTLLEDTLRSEVIEVSSAPAVGGVSKDGKALIKGNIKLEAFLVQEADIRELTDILVKNQMGKDKESKPETAAVEYTVAKLDFATGEVLLNVIASEETAFTLNKEDIKAKLIRKSDSEVKKILSEMPYVQSAQVILWPFWVRTIPENSERIVIDIR